MHEIATQYFLSEQFTRDVLSNLVFWLLDVVIIVMLVPQVLRRFEDRKWRPMRERLERLTVEHISSSQQTANIANSSFAAALRDCAHISKHGITTEKSHDLSYELEKWHSRYREDRRVFYDRVTVLLPSLTADMSESFNTAIAMLEERCEKCFLNLHWFLQTEKFWADFQSGAESVASNGERSSLGAHIGFSDHYARMEDVDFLEILRLADKMVAGSSSVPAHTESMYKVRFEHFRQLGERRKEYLVQCRLALEEHDRAHWRQQAGGEQPSRS